MSILKQPVLIAALVVLACDLAFAQGLSDSRPRKLAPGVITVIRDANIDDATLDETREFSELISVARPPEWEPNFDPTTETILEKAKRISFQRDVWSLEIGFKPLRVIKVGGRNIYYLIYYVRNTGDVRTAARDGETIKVTSSREAIQFIPSFVLQAHDLRQAYKARTLPDVVNRIAAKERVTTGVLYDSSSVARIKIPVSTPNADRRVWAVATWDNVDPRADLISVFVSGLTNAYRWQPPKGGYQPNKSTLEQDVVQSKALQINFWRGGDGEDLHDNEFAYGIPLYPNEPTRQQGVLNAYKLEKPLSHRWVYR